MITLFENDIRENGRRSSKGNQLKWESGGIWYKADYTGYEGLAEYVVSHLLLKSNLSQEEFALYDLCEIKYKTSVYCGAKSKNFLQGDWQIITLERLFQNVYGDSLISMIYHTRDHRERLELIVSQTERVTGLKDFGIYLSKMLTIDTFFLNEDRHTHNIAVLLNSAGEYCFCPFFDQGAALLSDTTMDYPLDGDIYEQMRSVQPKTFCQDFMEQLDIAEELYGEHLRFHFNKKYVDEILDVVDERMYSHQIIERVREVIYQQMRTYAYLFK